MKKFRKITTLILSFLFALPLFACEETGATEPTTPPAEEPTDEVEFYDDGGKYDAIIDKTEYSWSDSDGLLDGAFSDGAVEKDYASFSSEEVTNGSVVGSYYDVDDVPQISVVSGADLLVDTSVDETIRTKTKGSHNDDKTMTGIEESNFLKIENEGYKTVKLSIKPECTLEEFTEADFMSFKICIFNESTNANAANVETLYFKNRPILRMFRCTWYDVKIPLEIWRETSDSSSYADRAALYGSLKDETVSGDRSKGQCLQIVGQKSGISSDNDFVAYISDIKLGVEEIDETLGRNFATLTQTKQYNETTCPSNTYVFWGETEKVKTADECGVNRSLMKYTMSSHDGVNIAVKPGKTLAQMQKYDYVYVTMYIETDNPFPLQVGINGYYNVTEKRATQILKSVPQNTVLVSANKWITYKIPVKGYLERLYAPLTFTRVYTAANIPYVYYYTNMSLFFINGEYIRTEFADEKTQTYGMSVYVSRIFLVKE